MREVESIKTKDLTKMAMLVALTTVMTMVVQIPIGGTSGYLNLGDMVVFISALTLGRKGGFIVGGLGSSLADLLLGYSHYAPITLVVKGLEGYIAGYLLETKFGKKAKIFPLIIAGIFMAVGYYIPEIFMYGHKAAVVGLPANLMQGLLGAVAATLLFNGMKKAKS